MGSLRADWMVLEKYCVDEADRVVFEPTNVIWACNAALLELIEWSLSHLMLLELLEHF